MRSQRGRKRGKAAARPRGHLQGQRLCRPAAFCEWQSLGKAREPAASRLPAVVAVPPACWHRAGAVVPGALAVLPYVSGW